MKSSAILNALEKYKTQIYPIVAFNAEKDRISSLDLSNASDIFNADIYNDISLFTEWIEQQHKETSSTYLIGGYRENRSMYRRSTLFDTNEEPRSLHLGIDIWGAAGTKISAPLNGRVHSFQFNDNFGDYGATIILEHKLDEEIFFILYGHLAKKDLSQLSVHQEITKGEVFAHFGEPEENGHWPPHLHLQIIGDIGKWSGDYPGVCKQSEAFEYVANSPDPSILLKFS